jgi:hypothetical protein
MRRNHFIAGIILSLALSAGCAHRTSSRAAPPPSPTLTARAPDPEALEALRFPPDLHRTGPADLYPDPARTPGFPNPDINQANISQNICNPSWHTSTIRPPSSYTTNLKLQQMRDLGLRGVPGDYEEDHFISLELGGNPTDPRNLWPEAYKPKPGAKEKDQVENFLHKQVCLGAMTLQQAQRAIVLDWFQVYKQIHPSTPSHP